MLERLLHQVEPEFQLGSPDAAELLEHVPVVRGIDDDEHVAKVLGRRPDQARPADVDLLDQRVERGLGVLRGLGEGIQVHDDEIDGRDSVARDRREVVGPRAAGQDAGMDGWMKGLDPAVHHFGESGHIRDAQDAQTSCRERRGRPSSRDEFDPEGAQAPAKVSQPGFIRNAQNCSHICVFT